MWSRRLPRVRIVGLLVITLFIALCALLVRYAGVFSVALIYALAPTIVTAICSQVEWPRPWQPIQVIRRTLQIALVITLLFPATILLLVGVEAAMTVLFCHAALTALLWGPQYFVLLQIYKRDHERSVLMC